MRRQFDKSVFKQRVFLLILEENYRELIGLIHKPLAKIKQGRCLDRKLGYLMRWIAKCIQVNLHVKWWEKERKLVLLSVDLVAASHVAE